MRVPRLTDWATRLEGLTYSPPLHATHLTRTVSEQRGLSFERPLSSMNKTADQGNFFHLTSASCTGTGLFSAWDSILSGRWLWQMVNTENSPRAALPSWFIIILSRQAGIARHEAGGPGTRVGGLPCLACKCFIAFSRETRKKLALAR